LLVPENVKKKIDELGGRFKQRYSNEGGKIYRDLYVE
jgi:hypothetical protein